MRNPLDISYSWLKSFTITPSDRVLRAGKKLVAIEDIRKALKYYNRHLCSLAFRYPSDGLHIYGEYDDFHGYGSVFFKKKHINDPNFQIYLEERKREITRLIGGLRSKTSYGDKLAWLIEHRAGQPQLETLKVENNEWESFMSEGGGTVPDHLLGEHTVIDLTPHTRSETEAYNTYVRRHVQQIINDPGQFHWLIPQTYNGFRFASGLEAFKKQLARALDRADSIAAELRRIANKFKIPAGENYVELLYPYSINELSVWQAALFQAFLHGHDFDFGKMVLSVDNMKALIHVQEVYSYYKAVHALQSAGEPPLASVSSVAPVLSEPLEAVIHEIMERSRLSDFLSVPAPDIVIENAVWHNEQGQSIDCNIYHHKYGYKGFATDSRQPIVTSFQPVTGYEDPITHQYVYCQYYLPMLCMADQDIFHNKDGVRVVKVPFVQTHQQRPAASAEDFKLICEREFVLKKLPDSPMVRVVFFKELHQYIRELIQLHKAKSNYSDGLDIALLATSGQFLQFIDQQIQNYEQPSEVNTPKPLTRVLTGLFCRLVNDAGIMPRGASEDINTFCYRVCERYGLQFTVKVRQHYNGSESKKNALKLLDQIASKLSETEAISLRAYLQKQKLIS